MPDSVPVYRGLEESDRQRLIRDVRAAYTIAAAALPVEPGADPEEEAVGPTSLGEPVEIPEFEELIGIDASVYRQINAALAVGKQHLMFYGPPGTGKTTLAQLVCGVLHDAYAMITGSSDWTSQDVIGGYQPVGAGTEAGLANNRHDQLDGQGGALPDEFRLDAPVRVDLRGCAERLAGLSAGHHAQVGIRGRGRRAGG